jgi:hypothetical protein
VFDEAFVRVEQGQLGLHPVRHALSFLACVEQGVDVAFQLGDLTTRRPVLVDVRDQP